MRFIFQDRGVDMGIGTRKNQIIHLLEEIKFRDGTIRILEGKLKRKEMDVMMLRGKLFTLKLTGKE